jgi:hypothetical protein
VEVLRRPEREALGPGLSTQERKIVRHGKVLSQTSPFPRHPSHPVERACNDPLSFRAEYAMNDGFRQCLSDDFAVPDALT